MYWIDAEIDCNDSDQSSLPAILSVCLICFVKI